MEDSLFWEWIIVERTILEWIVERTILWVRIRVEEGQEEEIQERDQGPLRQLRLS